MQSAAESKRNELRQRLQPYFKNYADHYNEIPTVKVESFVREVLKQTAKQQVDYVIRNMFRVDADNSGKVSKNQLRDFLFRRHCGQMSLQKAHRLNKIARGKEHLINARQFHVLINNSLEFLSVTIDQRLSSNLFRLADKDNDNHITYVQYFQIINDAFCDNEVNPSPPPKNPPKKVWKSKFRYYLQVQLRRIYDKIILGRDLRELLGSTLSYQDQITLYRLQGDIQENNISSFAPFFNLFIVNLAIRGLRSFKDGSSQRTLNQSQFLALLYNTFEILNIQRVKLSLLTEIFYIVDLNKDKAISYSEYLDWVHDYLGNQQIDEARYYIKADSDYYSQNILQPINFINFTNLQFAIQTKQKLHSLIIPFDTNNDKILQNEQIINILINTLKSDQYQLQYFLSNLHRVNRGGVIGYQQFVDASLKYHYGQIINNRYHNSRRRSVWRIMDRQEFAVTLTSTLKAIRVQLNQQNLDIIWRTIDKQQYGWIHYDVYFYFLYKYFGIDYQDDWWERLQKLSVLERFRKIYFDQLTKGIQGYDQNSNKFYEQIQVKQIFKKYFCFQPYTSQTVLAYTYPYEKNLTLDTLIRITLEGYLVRFGVWNIRKGINKGDWNRQTINQDEFVQTLWNHSFFLDRKPPKQDLIAIFRLLDKRNSGRITLRQFVDFIKSTLGIGIQQFKEEQELDFDGSELAQLIWGELRQYFRDYDKDGSGFIDRSELGPFMKIVLGDQTRFGHALVFRNFGIKVDNNQDQMVSFTQFAPFAVSYAGQHALRTFHERQPKGRRLSLSLQQFVSVVQSAFRFLRSFDRYKDRLRTLYSKLGKGSEISYVQYFSWLESAITGKIRNMKWVK